MVFVGFGSSRRPLLTAQERKITSFADLQSFGRMKRVGSPTGVNALFYPAGIPPQIVNNIGGRAIYFDPMQGFFFVGGLEPAFQSQGEAEQFALSMVPPISQAVQEKKEVAPLALLSLLAILL